MGKSKKKKSKTINNLKDQVTSKLNEEGVIPLEEILLAMSDKVGESIVSLSYITAQLQHGDESRNEMMDEERYFPYMNHLSSVAYMLAMLGYDYNTISGGLLHDAKDSGRSTLKIKSNLEKFPYVVNGIIDICADAKSNEVKTKVDEKEDFLIKFFKNMWEFPESIPVKLADRLHNLWSFHTYKNPATQLRILNETIEYYLPLAEHFDLNLWKPLQVLTNRLRSDYRLYTALESLKDYDKIIYRIDNYAAIRGKEDIRKVLGPNVERFKKQEKQWNEEAGIKIFHLEFRRDGQPIEKIFDVLEVVKNKSRELLKKRNIRNFLEEYFEKDFVIEEITDILEYGIQRKIPYIQFTDAIAVLRRYSDSFQLPIVQYTPKGIPLVYYMDIRQINNPKGLPVWVTELFNQNVRCISQELSMRSVKLDELKSQEGIDLIGAETYRSVTGDNIPYLKIKSNMPLSDLITSLKLKLDLDNPLLTYSRIDESGEETVRMVYDVIKVDPMVILQPDFEINPYLVVDVFYKK